MPDPPLPLKGVKSTDTPPSDLRRWAQVLCKLHDVRFSKVLAARLALQGNKYDDEEVLRETARRLSSHIRTLCCTSG